MHLWHPGARHLLSPSCIVKASTRGIAGHPAEDAAPRQYLPIRLVEEVEIHRSVVRHMPQGQRTRREDAGSPRLHRALTLGLRCCTVLDRWHNNCWEKRW